MRVRTTHNPILQFDLHLQLILDTIAYRSIVVYMGFDKKSIKKWFFSRICRIMDSRHLVLSNYRSTQMSHRECLPAQRQ